MMRSSPSDIIRESLSMPVVADFYGHHPNRAGFIICPFHGEKTPSLKIYPQRWKCFGCGEGGDAIDFVRLLFGGLPFPKAIERISHDFNLGLLDTKPDPAALARIRRERAERERKAAERDRRIRALCERHRATWMAMRDNPPAQMPDGDILWPDEWVSAVHSLDYLEYLIEEG